MRLLFCCCLVSVSHFNRKKYVALDVPYFMWNGKDRMSEWVTGTLSSDKVLCVCMFLKKSTVAGGEGRERGGR